MNWLTLGICSQFLKKKLVFIHQSYVITMKHSLTLLIFILSFFVKASDLKISTPLLYTDGDTPYTIFNVSWDNAWNNEKNNDAVWLFFKSLSSEKGYQHINILKEGHSIVSVFSNNMTLDFEVPSDGIGLFLKPKNTFRGKVEATIKVLLDKKSFVDVDPINWYFTAYGIEMVNIPEGSFTLGDPDTKAQEYGSFFAPQKKGEATGLVAINSERQKLTVSETGDLFYEAGPEHYEGDQKGPIPSSYPKGVVSFYVMKYELNEGQYATFLNSLAQSQISDRVIINEEKYTIQGGTITFENDSYSTENPSKPCLFVGWDDAMAFADWAGLRPMTEFEYTKAVRGPSQPIAKEFPWGSNSKEKMQRIPSDDRMLIMANGWDESQLTDATKAHFGASYYWVMDMAGSLWERVITIGHPIGRAYIGSHGDGTLSPSGTATDQNWPTGVRESGGIGFRGGGFYGYDREYHEFNPFSPIAYRTYGGWHGGMRNNAYGTRFVRSSN